MTATTGMPQSSLQDVLASSDQIGCFGALLNRPVGSLAPDLQVEGPEHNLLVSSW